MADTSPVTTAAKAAALSQTSLSAILASATKTANLVSGRPSYYDFLSPTNAAMYVRTWPHAGIDALEENTDAQDPEAPNEDDSGS
ncbi:hypothetical protein ACFRAR_37275 [Kitasatospora sp. NPDC056651]|uniref:hypothetical protein n=1 Tax=Kitasatospora sp. NPDC056651 TaxID=3345892 RepID=UPI0036C5296A